MAGYEPLEISGFETGLIQERPEFLLVDDAFTRLENAYVWRQTVRKKQGKNFVGRLRRCYTSKTFFLTDTSPWMFNLLVETGYISAVDISMAPTLVVTTPYPHNLENTDNIVISEVAGALGGDLNGNEYAVANVTATTFEITQATANAYTSGGFWFSDDSLTSEPDAQIECGSFEMTINSETITDDGAGVLTGDGGGGVTAASGTINYATGAVSLTHDHGAGDATTITYCYFPGLPVMGLRQRELNLINAEDLIAFDTKYAYELSSGNFQELSAGTQWKGDDSDFFWSMNYWVDASSNKLFWVTNFSSPSTASDPIRYWNGTTWTDFAPLTTSSDTMYQARMLLPFRGRVLAFNTYEGTTAGGITASVNQPQRIRWSQIGTPIAADSWRSDSVGKGGYIDIPTAQHIVSAGFVRDNLVVFCERSTWLLRYTGRKFQPFEVEKVNTELGAESTFSLIQFDTYLLGMGDKRIVSCDSFKCEPIDIKIPDFAINIENENSGPERVQGIRDIVPRLAYWVYTSDDADTTGQGTYPNKRLLYNYEEDCWGIFNDSITCLGFRWLTSDVTWNDVAEETWETYNRTWLDLQANQPVLIGGNQQGYVHDLDQEGDDDESLFITAVTADGSAITTLTIPNHNLAANDIIVVSDIPTGTGYATALNDQVFRVAPTSADVVQLYTYNSADDNFATPFVTAAESYIGCGQARVKDNFHITTRKFDRRKEGQKIQVGHVDTLFEDTSTGDVTLRVLVDYVPTPVNTGSDSFFNVTVPTTGSDLDVQGGTQYWIRSFCPTRGNFVQLDYTLSNAQMNSTDSGSNVVISAMVLWQRKAGRLTM